MTIQAIPLSPTTACLAPDTPLSEALRLMLELNVNHLPICHGGRWAGLLSITELLGEMIPASARVEHGLTDLTFAGDATALLSAHLRQLANIKAGDAARRDLPVLRSDMPLLESALLLYRHDTPLPVVDTDGKLLGMLSRRAFLNYLTQREGGR